MPAGVPQPVSALLFFPGQLGPWQEDPWGRTLLPLLPCLILALELAPPCYPTRLPARPLQVCDSGTNDCVTLRPCAPSTPPPPRPPRPPRPPPPLTPGALKAFGGIPPSVLPRPRAYLQEALRRVAGCGLPDGSPSDQTSCPVCFGRPWVCSCLSAWASVCRCSCRHLLLLRPSGGHCGRGVGRPRCVLLSACLSWPGPAAAPLLAISPALPAFLLSNSPCFVPPAARPSTHTNPPRPSCFPSTPAC